jgi:hypothetical protein
MLCEVDRQLAALKKVGGRADHLKLPCPTAEAVTAHQV